MSKRALLDLDLPERDIKIREMPVIEKDFKVKDKEFLNSVEFTRDICL